MVMRNWRSLALALVPILMALGGCSSTPRSPETIPDPSTIDPEHAPTITIKGLIEGQLVQASKSVEIQYKVDRYPLGKNYQHVVFRLNNATPMSFAESSGKFELDEESGLHPGLNVFRAYLVRAWGESIKNPESSLVLTFFYKNNVGITPDINGVPVLTLVSPRGTYFGELGKKILFDVLPQKKVVKSGKKPVMIRYSLNGVLRDLPLGKAVYFEHLQPGKYHLKIDLLAKPAIRTSIDFAHDESVFEIREGLPE